MSEISAGRHDSPGQYEIRGELVMAPVRHPDPAGRGRHGAMTRLNVNDARCEALFASGLQPSDAPTAETVAEAINRTVQQFGIRGCAGQMAQEFGDHPDAAAKRMRWVRQLAQAAARPRDAASHPPTAVTARQQRPGLAHGSMAMTQP